MYAGTFARVGRLSIRLLLIPGTGSLLLSTAVSPLCAEVSLIVRRRKGQQHDRAQEMWTSDVVILRSVLL